GIFAEARVAEAGRGAQWLSAPWRFGSKLRLYLPCCRGLCRFPGTQAFRPFAGELVQDGQEGAVSPAEADYVFLVAGLDFGLSGAGHDVVLLADGSLPSEILQHVGEECESHAVGVFVEAVAPQSFKGEQLVGSPAPGPVPLHLGVTAAGYDAAGLFEDAEVLQQASGLLGRRHARPQRMEGRDEGILGALVASEVVVHIHAALRVPHEAVHGLPTRLRALRPLPGLTGLAQNGGDLLQVFFRLVKQTVQVHAGVMVSAAAERAEAEGDVVSRLAHGAVALVVVRGEAEARNLVAVFLRSAARFLLGAKRPHAAAELHGVLGPGRGELFR